MERPSYPLIDRIMEDDNDTWDIADRMLTNELCGQRAYAESVINVNIH